MKRSNPFFHAWAKGWLAARGNSPLPQSARARPRPITPSPALRARDGAGGRGFAGREFRGLTLTSACLLVLLSGCRRVAADVAPTIDRVDPDTGNVEAEVEVSILGAGFYVKGAQQFGGGPISIDDEFKASLTPTSGATAAQVALLRVRLASGDALSAVVPAGIAPGAYDLTVEGPTGTAFRAAAYAARTRAASLIAKASAPSKVTLGQRFTVDLRVTNFGSVPATGVAPAGAPAVTPRGALELVASPAARDLSPSGTETLSWTFIARTVADARVSLAVSGTDSLRGNPVSAADEARVLVESGATLNAAAALDKAAIAVGQAVAVRVAISNDGDLDATGVQVTVSPSDPPLVALISGSAASFDLPHGGRRDLAFTFLAQKAGSLTFAVDANGQERDTQQKVSAHAATAALTIGPAPAPFSAQLRAPSAAPLQGLIAVTMTVTNSGDLAVTNVGPTGDPGLSRPGAVELKSRPAGPVTVPGHGSQDFTWTYRTLTSGSITFAAAAAGSDTAGASLSATASATTAIGEGSLILDNPFQGPTTFSNVFGYSGRLYLAPNQTGNAAVSCNPDGSSCASVSFQIARDDGTFATSLNGANPPYSSFGAPGCARDTQACGPDDEDARGLFTSLDFAGKSWIFVGGAKSGEGGLNHVYMTSGARPTLAFSYVDLSQALDSTTRGATAALGLGNRLYIGFADLGAKSPHLLALNRAPSAPGLDAEGNKEVVDLGASDLSPIGGSKMIDALAAYQDRVYVANAGGCLRSTKEQPGPSAADWAACTPSAASFQQLSAISTSKTGNLEPADRAVPGFAQHHDGLYMARNTDSGPQLFVCHPSQQGNSDGCAPGDWSLVARNSPGLLPTSQFDDSANERISLLAVAGASLFVGFNNSAAGVVIYKTSLADPIGPSDFEGSQGCSAALGPSACPGLAGNGFGEPVRNTRIFSSAVLSSNGQPYLYLVAGNGVDPARVYGLSP